MGRDATPRSPPGRDLHHRLTTAKPSHRSNRCSMTFARNEHRPPPSPRIDRAGEDLSRITRNSTIKRQRRWHVCPFLPRARTAVTRMSDACVQTRTVTQTSRWSELGNGNVPTRLNNGSSIVGQNTAASSMRNGFDGNT